MLIQPGRLGRIGRTRDKLPTPAPTAGGTAVWASVNGVNKNQFCTVSNGNLSLEGNANTNALGGARSITQATGKIHYEITINQMTNVIQFGVVDLALVLGPSAFPVPGNGSTVGSNLRIGASFCNIYRNGGVISPSLPYGNTVAGDVFVCEFDTFANTIAYYQVRGGVALQISTTQTLTSNIPSVWHAFGGVVPQGTTPRDKFTANFGATAFAMTPSAGFSPYP